MSTMKRFICLSLLFLSLASRSSGTVAETVNKLNGTWMLDLVATEESLLRLRPFNGSASFMGMEYTGLLFLEFKGGRLLLGSLPNAGKTAEYNRVSEQAGKMTYAAKDGNDPGAGTIAVSFLGNRNISLDFSATPEMRFLLWKRVNADATRKTHDELKADVEAFFAMLMRLQKPASVSPDSPARMDATR